MNCWKCGKKSIKSLKFCSNCGAEDPKGKEGMRECSVCKKSFHKQGLKNHIINMAKGEVFRKEQKTPHLDLLKSIGYKPSTD